MNTAYTLGITKDIEIVFTKDSEVVNEVLDELTVTLEDSLKCTTEDAEQIARRYIDMCMEDMK